MCVCVCVCVCKINGRLTGYRYMCVYTYICVYILVYIIKGRLTGLVRVYIYIYITFPTMVPCTIVTVNGTLQRKCDSKIDINLSHYY